MEAISSILTLLFIIVILIAAFTFGFALLAWFFIFAMVVTGLVILKQMWFRLWFTKNPPPSDDMIPPPHVSEGDTEQTTIIEVDYEDLPPKR